MKAYKKLVLKAIELGYVVSVWDGEEFAVKRSNDTKAIFEAVESVELAELVFRDRTTRVGWAQVVPDLDDDETVSDYSCYVESAPSTIKYKWIDDCLDEGETS